MSENRAESQTQIYPLSGWQKVWSDYSGSPLAVAALFVLAVYYSSPFLLLLFHQQTLMIWPLLIL